MLLDAVTNLIKNYDVSGRYLDRNALDSLKSYYQSGTTRLQVAAMINANSPELVKNAGRQLFEEVPELIRAGGNAYTTRRYSACLRDLDYYLRYASYALVAGNNTVLDERVLQGLKETYNSLCVPIAPTVRGIQIMKEMIKEMALEAGMDKTDFIDEPFDHLTREFSDISV
ncbi:allophycocyanin subunit beta [Geminocystis sp. NIES-3709]|uniref:allophycocyanin subunit beta n=1 Tax=Geminocystis sp. NIES-3709 TaxID=1617448 RepID=UPI0005FC3B35|nr:allophycocyanin subunit beta [Geminocystis sp. NIES-3709]BAQ64404.1 allophycocyanin beta chain [Geminocystis sp. NIES-3709]